MTVYGDEWLLNYSPHLYQVPGYLPLHDYTQAVRDGDIKKATEIARGLNGLRAVQAKWCNGYGRPHGRIPQHEQKVWMELLGMAGGGVRAPSTPLSDAKRAELEADLAATGILDKVPGRRAIAAE